MENPESNVFLFLFEEYVHAVFHQKHIFKGLAFVQAQLVADVRKDLSNNHVSLIMQPYLQNIRRGNDSLHSSHPRRDVNPISNVINPIMLLLIGVISSIFVLFYRFDNFRNTVVSLLPVLYRPHI